MGLDEEENKPRITPKQVSESEYRIGEFKVSPDPNPSVYRKMCDAAGSKDK